MRVLFYLFVTINTTIFASDIDLPPKDLIYKVAGHENGNLFLESGENSLKDFETSLASIGAKFTDFKKILEWGCGCGRIMRHMGKMQEYAELHGCDTDEGAITWAKANLPFATFFIMPTAPSDSVSR